MLFRRGRDGTSDRIARTINVARTDEILVSLFSTFHLRPPSTEREVPLLLFLSLSLFPTPSVSSFSSSSSSLRALLFSSFAPPRFHHSPCPSFFLPPTLPNVKRAATLSHKRARRLKKMRKERRCVHSCLGEKRRALLCRYYYRKIYIRVKRRARARAPTDVFANVPTISARRRAAARIFHR